jgi:hypothetical protein
MVSAKTLAFERRQAHEQVQEISLSAAAPLSAGYRRLIFLSECLKPSLDRLSS